MIVSDFELTGQLTAEKMKEQSVDPWIFRNPTASPRAALGLAQVAGVHRQFEMTTTNTKTARQLYVDR